MREPEAVLVRLRGAASDHELLYKMMGMNPNRRELLFGLMASTVNASTADTVDLFEARQGGYALYRIPGIVVTSAGTILVYAEAESRR